MLSVESDCGQRTSRENGVKAISAKKKELQVVLKGRKWHSVACNARTCMGHENERAIGERGEAIVQDSHVTSDDDAATMWHGQVVSQGGDFTNDKWYTRQKMTMMMSFSSVQMGERTHSTTIRTTCRQGAASANCSAGGAPIDNLPP